MALNRFIFKNFKLKKLYLKYEIKRLALLFLFCQEKINIRKKFFFMRRLTCLPRRSSIVKMKNYCLLSGRSRNIYRKFSLSRTMLKKNINLGKISHYKKSSW